MREKDPKGTSHGSRIHQPCNLVKQKYTNPSHRLRTILLLDAGITQTAIARAIGVSRSAVSQVFTGERSTPRIVEAICTALGRSRAELFPELEEICPSSAE